MKISSCSNCFIFYCATTDKSVCWMTNFVQNKEEKVCSIVCLSLWRFQLLQNSPVGRCCNWKFASSTLCVATSTQVWLHLCHAFHDCACLICMFVLNICLSTSSVGCLAVHHHNMFVYIIFFGSLAWVRNGDILYHMLSRIIFFSLFEQSAKCGICNKIADSVQTQESSSYSKHCNSFVKFCLS
jgi:hypothetical protein